MATNPDPQVLYFFAYSTILREQIAREESVAEKNSMPEFSRELEEAE